MFEKWNSNEHERRMRFIGKLIGTGKTLDIGAYRGNLFEYLSIGRKDYYPIDAYKVKFKNAITQDLNKSTKLPYPDGYFDNVAFIGTIEHLFYPEEILSEIRRVMKPSGRAFISFPDDNHWYWKLIAHTFSNLDVPFDELKCFHHWFFGKKCMRELLGRYFKIQKEIPYCGSYGRFIGGHSEIVFVVRK